MGSIFSFIIGLYGKLKYRIISKVNGYYIKNAFTLDIIQNLTGFEEFAEYNIQVARLLFFK